MKLKFGKTEYTTDADTDQIGLIVWLGTKDHETAELRMKQVIRFYNRGWKASGKKAKKAKRSKQ